MVRKGGVPAVAPAPQKTRIRVLPGGNLHIVSSETTLCLCRCRISFGGSILTCANDSVLAPGTFNEEQSPELKGAALVTFWWPCNSFCSSLFIGHQDMSFHDGVVRSRVEAYREGFSLNTNAARRAALLFVATVVVGPDQNSTTE